MQEFAFPILSDARWLFLPDMKTENVSHDTIGDIPVGRMCPNPNQAGMDFGKAALVEHAEGV